MSKTTRLAPLVLAALVPACMQEEAGPPVSAAEEAMTIQALEDLVVVAAPYAGMLSSAAPVDAACVTTTTDYLTYVTVTFAGCPGPLAPNGTLHVERSGPGTYDFTADLSIRNVTIDGSAQLVIPANASEPRTLTGELVVAGPNRSLSAEATATWLVNGSCVTFSASGSVSGSGGASRSFQIPERTVCGE